VFAYYAAKFIRPEIDLTPQVEFKTPHGPFRVGFFTSEPRRIGFECDGDEFHDGFRDEFRDALLLGFDCLDIIYHIPGAVLTYYPHDALYLIAAWDGELFRPREKGIVAQLCTENTRQSSFDLRDERVMIGVRPEGRSAPPYLLSLIRRVREVPPGRRAHWKFLYSFAAEKAGINLDQLVASRLSEIAGKPLGR